MESVIKNLKLTISICNLNVEDSERKVRELEERLLKEKEILSERQKSKESAEVALEKFYESLKD